MLLNELRQRYLSMTEVIRASMEVFSKNFRTIAVICTVLYFPISILSTLISTYIVKLGGPADITDILMNRELWAEYMNSPVFRDVMIYTLLLNIISVLVAPIVTIAISKLTGNYIFGGQTEDYGEIIVFSFSKFPMMFLTSILASVIIFGGFAAFIIPGVIFSVNYYFFIQALALSEKNGIHALRYSRSLVRGKWLETFVFSIALYFMNYFFTWFVKLLFFWAYGSFFGMVIIGIALSTSRRFSPYAGRCFS